MNKTQIFLLSTGIILTTAAAATLSQRFLVTPNEVHQAAFGERIEDAKQRDAVLTGSSKSRASIATRNSKPIQTHTIKTTDGRTISYTSDNVHMKTLERKYADKKYIVNNKLVSSFDSFAGERYSKMYSPHNPTEVEITLNATITDLAGKTEHFSDTKICKHNAYQLVRETVFVDAYEKANPKDIYLGRFDKETVKNVKDPNTNQVVSFRYYKIDTRTSEFDYDDMIPGYEAKYLDVNSVVCSAGKTVFNF